MNAVFTSSVSICLLFTSSIAADTVVELNSNGADTQVLTNGRKARINTRDKPEYMIVDFSDNSIYSVSPESQQIITVSDSVPVLGDFRPPEIRLELEALGPGPTVAGYETTRFGFSANGDTCGVIHASQQALEDTSIGDVLAAINQMAENHLRSLGALASAIPDCQLARMEITRQLSTTGVPLQIVDPDGEIDSSVYHINTMARINPSQYELPKNYTMVSTKNNSGELLQTEKDLRTTQQHDPGMEKIMNSGNAPPRNINHMQHYREMQR